MFYIGREILKELNCKEPESKGKESSDEFASCDSEVEICKNGKTFLVFSIMFITIRLKFLNAKT